jgi:hypothetical protein
MKTKSKILSVLALLIVAIPFVTIGRTEAGKHAASVSIFRWPVYVKQPPIEIVEMKLANQRISSGASFSASDDWLRDFSVTVRNTSQKNVKLVRVRVEFARDANDNPFLPDIHLTGGQMFEFSSQFARTGEDLTLLPAKTIDLKASQEGCSRLPTDEKFMANPAGKLTTVSVEMALFDDNTGWISGNPVLRDKDNPSRWVRDKAWDASLMSNLKRFAGLRSSRTFEHHAEEKHCYIFDSAFTGSCGPSGSGCFQVYYCLDEATSGYATKPRSENCVGCYASSTTDTDTSKVCNLSE